MRTFEINDEILGDLELDAESSVLNGSIEKAGKVIGIVSEVDLTKQSTIDRAVDTTKAVFSKLEELVPALSLYAGENIPEEIKAASGLSAEQIADLLELKVFGSDGRVSDETTYTFYFGNEELLDDVLIEVSGSLEKGPKGCEIG